MQVKQIGMLSHLKFSGKDVKIGNILYLQECGKMGTYTLLMEHKFVQFLESHLYWISKLKIPLLGIYLKCTNYICHSIGNNWGGNNRRPT